MQTFATLFTTYLIYPVLTVVMVLFAVLMAKKNKLLKNRRLITYTLLGMFVLAAPAPLGFLNYNFMPWGYIVSAAVYLVAGYYHDRMLLYVFKKKKDEEAKKDDDKLKYRTKIVYTVILMILGILIFTLVFNLCNELKYGIWAATAMLSFPLVSILRRSYDIFIHIPPLVYKIWDYGKCAGYATPEDIDHSKLKVVLFEVFKNEGDPEPILLNIKVPEELMFGDWVKLLFEDYNLKNPRAPIFR